MLRLENSVGKENTVNAVSVAARSDDGRPTVILCYPLIPSRRTNVGFEPFPTLFWMSHDEIRASITDLEYKGLIQKFRERLLEDRKAFLQMEEAHRRYAASRWNVLVVRGRGAH
uniref:Uncharacterized protein n=1 Tax=Guillardia theta TaxID=55529 RepID=A0A7S4PMP7_GUITH